jgi:hypothetical protein
MDLNYFTTKEGREYGRGDLSRWPRGTLYPQNLTLTLPTSGGRSVGIVRSRTQTTEFSLIFSFKTKESYESYLDNFILWNLRNSVSLVT